MTTAHRAAAEAAWGARVRAHHEQTARVRETQEGGDFYAPVSRLFIADPRRTDDEVLPHLLPLARPEDTWLDIGAGAGRYALPLALRVRDVIALDPSAGMLDALREQATQHGISNVRAVEGRWPVDPAAGPSPTADVALIANLGYDVEAIGPFLDAMEAAAGRLCVAILADRQPSSPAHVFWPLVHGEERAALPALGDFLDLLRARGRRPEEARVPRPSRGFPTPRRAGTVAPQPALPGAGQREGHRSRGRAGPAHRREPGRDVRPLDAGHDGDGDRLVGAALSEHRRL